MERKVKRKKGKAEDRKEVQDGMEWSGDVRLVSGTYRNILAMFAPFRRHVRIKDPTLLAPLLHRLCSLSEMRG